MSVYMPGSPIGISSYNDVYVTCLAFLPLIERGGILIPLYPVYPHVTYFLSVIVFLQAASTFRWSDISTSKKNRGLSSVCLKGKDVVTMVVKTRYTIELKS